MKQVHAVTVNYGMTIKSSPEDKNEDGIYAELNFIYSDAEWELSKLGQPVRSRTVGEFETTANLKGIISLIESLTEVKETLERLEDELLEPKEED